jgi:hypothetical protein
MDADSSQHSALIHALRGHNLVIEGPLGTGKSQTITNLIAAALAKGKTVLFVSEKSPSLRRVLPEAQYQLTSVCRNSKDPPVREFSIGNHSQTLKMIEFTWPSLFGRWPQ